MSCGIAVAPPLAGVISGIVGGIIVGYLSQSILVFRDLQQQHILTALNWF
jgi:hypothetical protein